MGIDQGRFHVLVTEQLLNLTYIHTFYIQYAFSDNKYILQICSTKFFDILDKVVYKISQLHKITTTSPQKMYYVY